MREVGVLEAKTHLSSLLDAIEAGEEVLITRHGRPVAKMTAAPADAPRKSGVELAELFRGLRERMREEWQGEPDFDWKAAVEEGRE